MLYYNILVDSKKCDGCGRCVDACFERVLGIENGKAVLTGDPDECLGCEFCVEACPLDCISVGLRAMQTNEALPGCH